jgi:hypothetical protein
LLFADSYVADYSSLAQQKSSAYVGSTVGAMSIAEAPAVTVDAL